jgi:putative adenylate-forming enzyme
VRNRWLTFAFFDLFQPFDQHLAALADYRPSIIVAPAQVLRQLALAALAGRLQIRPKRVISAAEVLELQDRAIIRQAFGMPHEVYQATEGFLASTCEYGVLHLNEEYIHVEPEWLDDERRRFVPIITDFSRLTQPIVRYRLNDVLVARAEPCLCGRATRALARIEGRCEDMLVLPGRNGEAVSVFSDVLSRALAQALPLDADYRLVQDGPASLRLHAPLATEKLAALRAHLEQTLRHLGVDHDALTWTLLDQVPAFDPATKRRRIVRAVERHLMKRPELQTHE